MLKRVGKSLKGMRVSVSGSGNVAQYAVEKAMQLGAKVVTVSDSGGTVVDEAGFTPEKLAKLMEIKNIKYGRCSEYAAEVGAQFIPNARPWNVPVDVALPCATQNELDENDAKTLIKNGVVCVAEGANMPSMIEAAKLFGRCTHSVRSGQGKQCRGCRDFGSGNVAKRHSLVLDTRRSGSAFERNHEEHSQCMCQIRYLC